MPGLAPGRGRYCPVRRGTEWNRRKNLPGLVRAFSAVATEDTDVSAPSSPVPKAGTRSSSRTAVAQAPSRDRIVRPGFVSWRRSPQSSPARATVFRVYSVATRASACHRSKRWRSVCQSWPGARVRCRRSEYGCCCLPLVDPSDDDRASLSGLTRSARRRAHRVTTSYRSRPCASRIYTWSATAATRATRFPIVRSHEGRDARRAALPGRAGRDRSVRGRAGVPRVARRGSSW